MRRGEGGISLTPKICQLPEKQKANRDYSKSNSPYYLALRSIPWWGRNIMVRSYQRKYLWWSLSYWIGQIWEIKVVWGRVSLLKEIPLRSNFGAVRHDNIKWLELVHPPCESGLNRCAVNGMMVMWISKKSWFVEKNNGVEVPFSGKYPIKIKVGKQLKQRKSHVWFADRDFGGKNIWETLAQTPSSGVSNLHFISLTEMDGIIWPVSPGWVSKTTVQTMVKTKKYRLNVLSTSLVPSACYLLCTICISFIDLLQSCGIPEVWIHEGQDTVPEEPSSQLSKLIPG